MAAKVKLMDLAKELGVTSKELMVAAEEMGHKGLRAMSPLDTTLANALRVKLGRGRELPEEPKPKRAAKPKDVAATDGAPGPSASDAVRTAPRGRGSAAAGAGATGPTRCCRRGARAPRGSASASSGGGRGRRDARAAGRGQA